MKVYELMQKSFREKRSQIKFFIMQKVFQESSSYTIELMCWIRSDEFIKILYEILLHLIIIGIKI